MAYQKVIHNMVSRAKELLEKELENGAAKEAFMIVLESGRAVEIAEKFCRVSSERTLLVGIGRGIVAAWGLQSIENLRFAEEIIYGMKAMQWAE